MGFFKIKFLFARIISIIGGSIYNLHEYVYVDVIRYNENTKIFQFWTAKIFHKKKIYKTTSFIQEKSAWTLRYIT